MILSFALTAFAQQPADWQFVAGAVLSPNPGITYMSESIGSPAVAYDSLHNRFTMFFESRTPTVDARCPQGVWTIGAATSTDGVTWTPLPNPIINNTPGSGTFYSCVAAHPTATFAPGGANGNGGYNVVFKGEQDTDACDVTTPSWGCDTVTGFGRIAISLTATGNIRTATTRSTPIYVPTATTFGYPKLVREGTNYLLAYQAYPDIWAVQGPNMLSLANPIVAVRHSDYVGIIPWVVDELYNPSFVCDDDPVFPYAIFAGGRDTNAGTVISGAWGKAVDDVWADATAFALDSTAQQEWLGNDQWRHFDVTKLSTGEYLVWFDEKDVNGDNFIRFGGTTLTFNNTDVVSRICP